MTRRTTKSVWSALRGPRKLAASHLKEAVKEAGLSWRQVGNLKATPLSGPHYVADCARTDFCCLEDLFCLPESFLRRHEAFVKTLCESERTENANQDKLSFVFKRETLSHLFSRCLFRSIH